MGNATSSDDGAVATPITMADEQLCISLEDRGTRIRLTYPGAFSLRTHSTYNGLRKALNEQVQLKPEEISRILVVGDILGHDSSESALEKFLRDLKSFPRLNEIDFILPEHTARSTVCIRRARPLLQSLSFQDVRVWRGRVVLRSHSLRLQLWGKRRHQHWIDALVKEVLGHPTAHKLWLRENFSGPQTYAALLLKNHLTELTLGPWSDPPGEFVMQTLANALTPSQKRKRGSNNTATSSAPPLRLHKLTLRKTKLMLADFELLATALKNENNTIREFHLDDCKIVLGETQAQQEKDRLRDAIFVSLLKENRHLIKFSFTRMQIEVLHTWGISVGEVSMSTDFPLLCQVLENDNWTIQSIDFASGESRDELPAKAKLYLALNTFGFRQFMGKALCERDEFLRILIRARGDDMNTDTDLYLVPSLFEMFRSNPLLVGWLS